MCRACSWQDCPAASGSACSIPKLLLAVEGIVPLPVAAGAAAAVGMVSCVCRPSCNILASVGQELSGSITGCPLILQDQGQASGSISSAAMLPASLAAAAAAACAVATVLLVEGCMGMLWHGQVCAGSTQGSSCSKKWFNHIRTCRARSMASSRAARNVANSPTPTQAGCLSKVIYIGGLLRQAHMS